MLIAKITTRPTDKIAAHASAAEWLLTPKRRANGKFHYPTAGGVFKKLQNEDKDLFLLEIVRNDVKKHKMQLFPFRFHLT